MYWMTTQDGTREIEIFNKLFDRYYNIHVNRVSSLKQFTEYFNFLCKIQLDHPVLGNYIGLNSGNGTTLNAFWILVDVLVKLGRHHPSITIPFPEFNSESS